SRSPRGHGSRRTRPGGARLRLGLQFRAARRAVRRRGRSGHAGGGGGVVSAARKPAGRIRVMHVLESMHRGGAESVVVEHARHAARDVETLVVALNRGGPALEEAEAAGARTFRLSKHGGRAGGVTRLARLMREQEVRVVNGHNPTGALYAVAAARLAGVP